VATPVAANVLAGLAACVENVSAAARSLSSVAFAAEVAEKSGAAFPLSICRMGALTCACATLTLQAAMTLAIASS